MENKSLKNYTDEEIILLFRRALEQARAAQYAEIRTTVSGGKVKFMTVEVPVAQCEQK